MEQHHCLGCERVIPEDCGRLIGLVLMDERGQESQIIGTWCDEKCLGEWLVKSALDAMLKRMMQPSSN